MKQTKKLHPFMDHLRKAKKQNAEQKTCNAPHFVPQFKIYNHNLPNRT